MFYGGNRFTTSKDDPAIFKKGLLMYPQKQTNGSRNAFKWIGYHLLDDFSIRLGSDVWRVCELKMQLNLNRFGRMDSGGFLKNI